MSNSQALNNLLRSLPPDSDSDDEDFEANINRFASKVDLIVAIAKAYQNNNWNEWKSILEGNAPTSLWYEDGKTVDDEVDRDIKTFFNNHSNTTWRVPGHATDPAKQLLLQAVNVWLIQWSSFFPHKDCRNATSGDRRARWWNALRIIRNALQQQSGGSALNWIQLWQIPGN